MRVFALPIFFLGFWEVMAIIGIAILVSYSLKRGRRHEQEQRYRRLPRPRPPVPAAPPPPVNIVGLTLALMVFPVVLAAWAIASIGDIFAVPAHLFVGTLTGTISLFITLIGGSPRKLWKSSGVQFVLAWKSLRSMIVRLFAMFGMGGLVRGKPKPPPIPASRHASPRPVPGHRTYPFEDRYRIESLLGAGGSTARLFVVRRVDGARPVGDRMVLKYFDMGMGSRLEEVIRESRGMQVAKDMGIVLDHHLDRNHFYYVMPYYEGETLTRASARLHRHLKADEGLSADSIRTCLAWMSELLRTLDGYHRQGVIHKDVKPDNLIVTEQGVRLVDLGLLTPLASALTLTTHGTEFFRDPEMVKLAVQGKRVRDVEAVRFDIYSAGAVMYLLLDGSFPACGPLSRISRPGPMALSWITSRAMAEGEKRYPSVAAMRADLEAVIAKAAESGYDAIPVSALPSFSGFDAAAEAAPPPPPVILRPEPKMAPPERLVPISGRPHRSNSTGSAVAVVIGVLLMIFVAAGAVFLLLASGGVERPLSEGAPRITRDGLFSAPPSPGMVEARPNPDPPPAITPAHIVGSIRNWRAKLADDLLPSTSVGDLERVPVLLVSDGTSGADEIIGATKVVLQKSGILYHPSTTLAANVRTVLEPGIGAEAVRDFLLSKMAGDTLPFVIWIRHVDDQPRHGRCGYQVVCFYGPYRHSIFFSPPTVGRER